MRPSPLATNNTTLHKGLASNSVGCVQNTRVSQLSLSRRALASFSEPGPPTALCLNVNSPNYITYDFHHRIRILNESVSLCLINIFRPDKIDTTSRKKLKKLRLLPELTGCFCFGSANYFIGVVVTVAPRGKKKPTSKVAHTRNAWSLIKLRSDGTVPGYSRKFQLQRHLHLNNFAIKFKADRAVIYVLCISLGAISFSLEY